jgi:hypothetical protein
MTAPADTFALLKLTDVGDDNEGRPGVALVGTQEQVKIAARWLGMSVALSGSGDLLNAYRREAAEDARTITGLRLELEAARAEITRLRAELKTAHIHALNDSSEIANLRAELRHARQEIEAATVIVKGSEKL